MVVGSSNSYTIKRAISIRAYENNLFDQDTGINICLVKGNTETTCPIHFRTVMQ